jgi:hypothetical protein
MTRPAPIAFGPRYYVVDSPACGLGAPASHGPGLGAHAVERTYSTDQNS